MAVFGVRLNCQAGLRRFALGLVVLWFTFWTFAYVLNSRAAENDAVPPAFTLATDLALAATLLLLAPWTVLGFRPEFGGDSNLTGTVTGSAAKQP